MGFTLRLSHLLGECRRQMNGAVAGSMRYYGADYVLNYGVSLPTVRSLAASEGKDHLYAKYLFEQQVREIRLASLHIAQAQEITSISELDFWARGIINSELAEEAAFVLFQHVPIVIQWTESENDLLLYTALLSISKSNLLEVGDVKSLIYRAINKNISIITSAIVTLLESYYRSDENRPIVEEIIRELPQSPASKIVKEEMAWRMECQ